MNYKQLLDANGGRHITYHIRFGVFCEERMIEFAKEIEGGMKELHSLGDNLTQDDYERVVKLTDKIERNAASYASMSYLGPSKEQRDIGPSLRLMGEEGFKKHREMEADEKLQKITRDFRLDEDF